MTQLDNFKFFQENDPWKEVGTHILNHMFEQRRLEIEQRGRHEIERMARIMGGESMFHSSSLVIPFSQISNSNENV